MLVLSRKPGETIMIGNDIAITLIDTKGGRARIGITAPPNVCIFRGELQERQEFASVPTSKQKDLIPSA